MSLSSKEGCLKFSVTLKNSAVSLNASDAYINYPIQAIEAAKTRVL